MTIVSEITRQTFQGNGAQSVFGYTFLLPTVGQYQLYYTDADDVSVLVDQANYSVSGVGNPAGGNVTYLPGGTPIAAGTSITITRAIPYTQTTELGNQGAYYPQVIEGTLDRVVQQVQQLHTTAEQSVRAPVTDPVMAELPPVAARANKPAAFDAQGNLVGSTTTPSGGPFSSIEIAGTQDIATSPITNPVDTFSSLVVDGTTAHEGDREFLVLVDLVSNKGSSAASPERDKVALYSGVRAEAGTGDVWSLNTVVTLAGGSGSYSALGYELDFNNLNAHRGDTPGAAGLAAPIAYGLAITGVASYRSTSALLISGASSSVWNRGITITAGVVQSSIQDVSTAARAIDLQGSYTHAIDVSASVSSTSTIQMGTQQYVFGKLSGGTAIRMLGMDGTNQLLLGDSAANVAISSPALVPAADNVVALGGSSRRWTEVYAANGTINTSDEQLKRDVSPLASMTDLLREVQPISFKFKDGGADLETVTEQQLLPVQEEVEAEREVLEIVDGKAVARKVRETVMQPVFDEFPVVDENGEQIVDWTKPVLNRDGSVRHPSVAVPRVHRVSRMAMQDVQVQRFVVRPGKRKHFGFKAGDIDKAVKKLGLGDIGVFVKGADGIEGLRTDQLVAVLWQAMRELDERLEAVES